MGLIQALSSTIWAIVIGILQFLVPVWIAFVFGVVMGWVWKPRWANYSFRFSAPFVSPIGVSSPVIGSCSGQSLDICTVRTPNIVSCLVDEVVAKQQVDLPETSNGDEYRVSDFKKECSPIITDQDLEHLCLLVERRDEGPPWKHAMDRSTESMSYQAWQRDFENGPPQYCSRTVYEDASPELMRDFFWDDEFRLKWDDMFSHADILDECSKTGTMVVQWIRKFPFFCSDREYIIGRRIWESGQSYYCVNKGVPFSSVAKKDKPRRVDIFYSSWFIQAVGSRKNNGSSSACEVILFHHEDMGIPWEIMKFGVRHGMWGAVKNIERGFRAYQKHRSFKTTLSHHVIMARMTTKIEPGYLSILEGDEHTSETQILSSADEKPKNLPIPKLMILVGGAVALACTLDRGMLAKAVVFDVARRFGHIGRRGMPRTR